LACHDGAGYAGPQQRSIERTQVSARLVVLVFARNCVRVVWAWRRWQQAESWTTSPAAAAERAGGAHGDQRGCGRGERGWELAKEVSGLEAEEPDGERTRSHEPRRCPPHSPASPRATGHSLSAARLSGERPRELIGGGRTAWALSVERSHEQSATIERDDACASIGQRGRMGERALTNSLASTVSRPPVPIVSHRTQRRLAPRFSLSSHPPPHPQHE
jgi:hypothetical protein